MEESSNSYEDLIISFQEIAHSFNRNRIFIDILYDNNYSLNILKTKSTEKISLISNRSGIVMRTFNGIWNEWAMGNIPELINTSRKVPSSNNQGVNLERFEGWTLNKVVKLERSPFDIPIGNKLDAVRNLFKSIQNFDSRISNTKIQYKENLITRIYVNNEGCELRQVIPRTRLFIKPIAKKDGIKEFDYYSRGGQIGFDIVEGIQNEEIEKIANNSLEMLKAKSPPSGEFPIILDANMAGLVAHESFGHGLEADQILRGRSYLTPYINKRVASDICEINDTPNLEAQNGSYFFDDEGIKAGDTILVKEGVLINLLHNRETASRLKSTPKGNGRRESYIHPIHVRMSNTYFKSGDMTIQEMISELKDGVFLVGGYFGMEDPLGGGMQCTSKKGYLIEGGQISHPFKSITLSGPVLELLQNIDGISKEKLTLKPGNCGKGDEDTVPVTTGGSAIKVKKALISPG